MKLNSLLSIIIPSRREPQTCESCQQPFICGASLMGCWCTEVKLTPETRANLKAKYSQCLCRTCLENSTLETPQDLSAN